MSASFLKLIQAGATAEIADAVAADPGLAWTRDPQGISMLLWSVYFAQPVVRDFLVARLAEEGVALDIFEAAALGDNGQIRALLQADPDLASSYSGDGWTPLHLAAAFGSPAAASILIAARAPIDAVSRNPQQNQPLHAALALGKDEQTIRLLLDHGASVNATQAGGFTALFSAATANRKDLAELLLSHGAHSHHRSDEGKTAADLARDRGHVELASWLQSHP